MTTMLHKQKTSQSEDTDCDVLTKASLHIVNQLATAIGDMTQSQYAESPEAGSSSVGAHARHVIEFYQALFNVIHANGKAELCYDKRQRNSLLERSKDSALEEMSKIKGCLSDVSSHDFDIHLSSIVDSNAPMFSMRTTLQRELFYLLDHAVHHMAIIKMIAARHGFVCGQHFGLAQSTKAHESAKS